MGLIEDLNNLFDVPGGYDDRQQTCNHEHDPSDHGCCGFDPGFVVHEAGALHPHGGDHQSHSGEEDAEQHHAPGNLDLTWQLEEVLVKLTGCSLVAAAGHPQALEDSVRFSLILFLPFNHQSSSDGGEEADQREEEPEQLQSRAGHRVRMQQRWMK